MIFCKMCVHSFLETDYCTIVCKICGQEKRYIKSCEGYSSNVPLSSGYSRHHRMTHLLNQLFKPRHFGTPNPEVVANAIMHGPFENGFALLDWLSKLRVKHKQYQNAHYYFAISSPDYMIPDSPSTDQVLSIEREFHILEQRFRTRRHTYKSFFSYNWLLRKFLQEAKLEFYLQFVKKIKCKKRMKIYRVMWEFFKIADSVVIVPGVSLVTQRRPVSPLANVLRPPLAELSFLDHLLKTYLNKKVIAT